MKFYSLVQKIKLHEHTLQKARQFANAVTPSTVYADTNQFILDKVINDHFISKLGEEAVKAVMSRFADVTGPDYNIYQGKEKSWMADLFINNMPLAIKTQATSAAMRYGLSWTFQCSAKRKDILLHQPEAWVAFVEYDDTHKPYQTCFVLPPFQIKELVFGEPRLAYLKQHKKVVYAASLPKLKVENGN